VGRAGNKYGSPQNERRINVLAVAYMPIALLAKVFPFLALKMSSFGMTSLIFDKNCGIRVFFVKSEIHIRLWQN